ncbi:MAG: serine hydrolase domain-containing protein [Woeseiaceae bacterium]|nr:serine hydrolase domain-containing protein [Woeseiaceae bacterium]
MPKINVLNRATLPIALLTSAALTACSYVEAVPSSSAVSSSIGTQQRFGDSRIQAVKDDISARIQGFINNRGVASVTIIAFTDKDVLWQQSFGYANVGAKLKASHETVYNTGSTFKIVIVTAIMQLVEAGRLDLDLPVNRHLTRPINDFSGQGAPLTLRHMLSHHAGLPPSRPVPDWDIWSRASPPSTEEQIADLTAVALPGREYDYCNICFPLYAEVIEKATSMSLERYLRENILVPIGAKYTEPLYPDAQMVENMALPYEQIGNKPFPMPQKFLESWMAGDAYQRPLDFVTFLRVFLNEGKTEGVQLLSSETVASMFVTQFDSDVSLGFISEVQNGRHVLWWDGGIYGGSAVYHLEPVAGIGVYIASNSNMTTDELHVLARRTRDLLFGTASPSEAKFTALDEPPQVEMPRQELARFAGTYELEEADVSLRVDILNNHLALTNPAGKRFDIVLTSPHEGVLVGPRENIRFTTDDEGVAIGLHIGQEVGTYFLKAD